MSELKYLNNPDHIICKKCDVMACLRRKRPKRYFITIDLEHFTIYWLHDYCMVDLVDNLGDHKKSFHLPLLPYNLTIDKLKTYLIFS